MSAHAKTTAFSRVVPPDVLNAGIIEFIGTALLVLFPTVILALPGLFDYNADPLTVDIMAGFAFGVTLFVLVSVFARQSGANFNPAITFGLWLHGQMAFRTAYVYWVAQVIGGIVGALLARLVTIRVTSAGSAEYGLTSMAPGLSLFSVFLIEFIGTAFLTLAVAAVAIAKQAEGNAASVIGAALGVLVSFGALLTGGAYNPARLIGPIVTSGNFSTIWYILPELAGGWAGMTLYLLWARRVKQPQE